MKWQDWITLKPDVCHGKACIKGMRFMVSVILGSMAVGESNASLLYAAAPDPEERDQS